MTPYICKGAIVKSYGGKEGKVISVDHGAKIAVVNSGSRTYTEDFKNLKVISYKEAY